MLVFALLGLANAQVELTARQNDASFERRQTVCTHYLPINPPAPRRPRVHIQFLLALGPAPVLLHRSMAK